MNEVVEFFKKLSDVKDFPARWNCGRWSDFHGWLYIISDVLIGLAYFVIPILIIRFITKKTNRVDFHWLYILFASFIWFCGLTHFIDSLIFWFPVYRISALVRLATALISWITIVYVVKVIPIAFSLRSPKELENEISLRMDIEEKLLLKNLQLNESKEIARLASWQWLNDKIVWTDSAIQLFQFSPDINTGNQSFLAHIHEEDREFVESVLLNIFSSKTFPDFYCRIITRSNKVKHVMLRGMLRFNDAGEVSQINGTIQDITEERQAVEKIQIQNEKLREIAWIHAHKVRSPLSSVLGLTDLLLTEDMPADQRKVVEMLYNAAHNLDETISEITRKAHLLNIE